MERYKHAVPNQEKSHHDAPRMKRNMGRYLFSGVLVPVIVGTLSIAIGSHEYSVSTVTLPAHPVDTEPASSTIEKTPLRNKPEMGLLPETVQNMLKEKGLHDSRRNSSGAGVSHKYEAQNGGTTVYDHASGLRWQQSGSRDAMNFKHAKDYVSKLNHDRFAGYNDWHLPTLEEAMSLMEPAHKHGDLHADSVFDPRQRMIWTSDFRKNAMPWVVRFDAGYCDYVYNDGNVNYWVRAVR